MPAPRRQRGPEATVGRRPRRRVEPEPEAHRRELDPRLSSVDDVLFLQRHAGNAAVSRALVQRKSPKPKPAAELKARVEQLEHEVIEGNWDEAKRLAAEVDGADHGFFLDLLVHVTHKQKDEEVRKAWAYVSPGDYGPEIFKLAVSRRDATAVERAIPHLFSLSRPEIAKMARDGPKFFVEHVLMAARERPGNLVDLLQDTALMEQLKNAEPKAFGSLAKKVPQLAVVKQVREELGAGAGDRDIVDEIFAAVLENRGIKIAYSATAIAPVEHILTGETEASKSLRKDQAKVLDLPKIPATDCHHLLSAFESILKTYAGLTVEYERKTLTKAALTQPLNTLPGGLIKKDFTGNVFDEAGRATRQIFFTGEDGVNSHSWLRVKATRWKAYDPLFGTTGKGVEGGVAGKFTSAGPGVFKEDGGDRYLVKDPTLKVASNPYGFSNGYRLTTDPARLGGD